MLFRNLVWLVVALSFVASGCSEERPKQDHDHAPRADGACCEFHAKKEVAPPKRVELGKGAAGGIAVTAAQVGAIKAGDWALIQVKTDKPLPEGSRIRAWIGDEQGKQKTTAEYCEVHDEWDAEVSVPATIAPGMKWWVEVEPKGGPGATTSFALGP